MKLNKPLCILCWLLTLPLILAMMLVVVKGEELTPEKVPDGLQIVSLTAEPQSVELANKFAYRQVLITGKLASGEQIDLTRIATLESPAKFVTITPTRRLEALGNGDETLKFSYGDLHVEVAVKVSGFDQPYPVSFVRDVHRP